MATTTSNGHARTVDDTPRIIQRIPGALTPDQVMPRLVGMGMPADVASQLADQHDEQRIVDALDAVEELGDTSRIMDPVGWVQAAIRREWDLSGVLATRRENERRLGALDAARSQREEARAAFPVWRAISDRWDRAISAALDDGQLAHAIGIVARPVPGVGRHSVPVTRAELIAWAVDVHGQHPDAPLAEALAHDLDRGPRRPEPSRWPLPEPPTTFRDGDVRPLAFRIADLAGHAVADRRDTVPEIEVPVPHRTVRFEREQER